MMVAVLLFALVGSFAASRILNATMGSFSVFMTLLLGIKFIMKPVITAKESMEAVDGRKRMIRNTQRNGRKRQMRLRRIREGIAGSPFVKMVSGHPLYRKCIKTRFFQVKVSLLQGSSVNLLYAGVKLFSGIYYHSVWLIVLAFYYGLLACMRISLLAFSRKEEETGRVQAAEWEKYRRCGIMLLFMNQVLTGILVLVVVGDKSFEYAGALIYAMAIYSFYAITMSVRNMVKARKYASPVMAAARVVSMTAALVSMFSLETVMLARFGNSEGMFRRPSLIITGGGICAAVFGMAVYMIARAAVELKKERNGSPS